MWITTVTFPENSAAIKYQSDYETCLVFPDEVGYIKKLVLKEPTEGFPPVFRIRENTSLLSISGEAKAALEAAGIKGCLFEEVETTS